MSKVLSRFQILRPTYEEKQENALQWIANIHAQTKTNQETHLQQKKTLEENKDYMQRMVEKFCCSPDKIATRGSEVEDFLLADEAHRKIYNCDKFPQGAPIESRMEIFFHSTKRIFEEFYSQITTPPKNLIHVTCTGYMSPSAPQWLLSQKKWGHLCQVTHAYHMGCYASIPAIHMAQGFLSQENSDNKENRVDIVHTELCTLHFNPAIHSAEQFVIQSLFADGYIFYSMQDKKHFLPDNKNNALEILSLQEILYTECADAMTWNLGQFGFQMTISRSVPSIIAENIQSYLIQLFDKAHLKFENEKPNVLFAIHPGGPKIIESIAHILKLKDEQVALSIEILNNYGNMSSATLPHIWELISKKNMAKNTLVVSLAFGPGLTIAGGLMKII
jgi:predicted naringenin-chalcone synthase